MTDSNQDLVIIQLDRAKQALAEAKTIQQTKTILDKACAAEIYAKRQQLSQEAIAYAHDLKLEALRLLGHMLRQRSKAKGGQPYQGRSTGSKSEHVETLADLGINKKISMVAQRLADLPQAEFEQLRVGGLSLSQVMKRASPPAAGWSIDACEQRLLAAIRREIEWAPSGSQPCITDLVLRLGAQLKEADRPELRDAVAIARDELSIRDAEPGGFRIFEDEQGAATHSGAPRVVASCKSTYPRWYQDLTTKKEGVTPLKRKPIEASLADIDKGKLPTARTAQTYWAVLWAIKDLSRTSSLGRGVK